MKITSNSTSAIATGLFFIIIGLMADEQSYIHRNIKVLIGVLVIGVGVGMKLLRNKKDDKGED